MNHAVSNDLEERYLFTALSIRPRQYPYNSD